MTYTKHITFIAVSLFVLCFTQEAYAAQVTFKVVPNLVEQDTATIVEAYIDPQGESLNATEGTVGFFGKGVENVSLVVVETGGSAFSLWPVLPQYSTEERVIRFTGGTTESVTDESLLLRMRIFSSKSGDVSVSLIGGSAYRNDGVGTAEGISSLSLAISLTHSEPNQITASYFV